MYRSYFSMFYNQRHLSFSSCIKFINFRGMFYIFQYNYVLLFYCRKNHLIFFLENRFYYYFLFISLMLTYQLLPLYLNRIQDDSFFSKHFFSLFYSALAFFYSSLFSLTRQFDVIKFTLFSFTK